MVTMVLAWSDELTASVKVLTVLRDVSETTTRCMTRILRCSLSARTPRTLFQGQRHWLRYDHKPRDGDEASRITGDNSDDGDMGIEIKLGT